MLMLNNVSPGCFKDFRLNADEIQKNVATERIKYKYFD